MAKAAAFLLLSLSSERHYHHPAANNLVFKADGTGEEEFSLQR